MKKEEFSIERNLTPISLVTYDCNLGCKYCYIGDNRKRGLMKRDTAKNIIEKVVSFNGQDEESCFIWQGGEALLAGLDFYRQIIDIQRGMTGYRFENLIQTNGTLLTEEFIDFFKENDFSLGMSLDGPQEINDKTRVYKTKRNGSNGTFTDILKSIELLRAKGRNTGVIVTLNRHNVHCVRDIYQFLKANDIGARFNPLFKSGRAIEYFEELTISPEEYENAMSELIDIWVDDEKPVHLKCLEGMFENVLTEGKHPGECVFSHSCQKELISIRPNGDVYPCGDLKETKFKYGNINEDSLEKILLHPLRKRLIGRANRIEECRSCDYKKSCNGGCMSHAYAFTGDIMDKDPYCPAYKYLFKQISSKIPKNDCKEVKDGNS